jgi:hypothetical protein
MLLKGNSIAFSKQKKEFYKIILKGKESKKRPFRNLPHPFNLSVGNKVQ